MIRQTIQLGSISTVICDRDGRTSLLLVPAGMEDLIAEEKTGSSYAMAQLHIHGDKHEVPYSRGITMLGSSSAAGMKLTGIETTADSVTIEQENEAGLHRTQMLSLRECALHCKTVIENRGKESITLDQASTFCIGGMTPFEAGPANDCLKLHRFSSFWSCEGRHECQTVEDLNMEVSWSRWATKTVKIGQYGTMPVRGYFPVMALEDTKRNVTWAASLAWAGSWNMELFRQKDDLALAGGLAGFEEGHWRKTLAPGESITLPEAALTVVRGGVDEACEALLDVQKANLKIMGEAEDTLNPMYNEYCDTWGAPTEKTIDAELKAIKDLGLSYFVIDAGWYGQNAKWEECTGDWDIRKSAFPDGLKPVTDKIRKAGMIPGLWFEAEVASDKSAVFTAHPEMFVKEDGKPINETNRVFLNLSRDDAQEYLKTHVIDLLKENGFGYIKVDYNNTYGLGFDGFESLGEAQRQGILGTYAFFDRMHGEIPDLVVENCSSGGHRLETGMMKRCSMASFSDAHECPEIPLIAADLHRLILPRQSQIWSVLRAKDSIKRIMWSLSATLLGRMCISGEVAKLSEEQKNAVKDGIRFYRLAAPVIKDGSTKVYRSGITSYANAHGWQCAVRTGGSRKLITVHAFEKHETYIEVPGNYSGWKIADRYMPAPAGATLEDGKLRVYLPEEYMSATLLLEKCN